MKLTGLAQSMLVTVFTFSGINTVAMATSKVKKPESDIPKATVIIIAGILFLYVATIFLLICTVNWNSVNTNISPLVQSLDIMKFGWASSIINAAIFIAAFSVILGTYFGSVQILISLSNAGEAPGIFNHKRKSGFFRNAWILTGLLSLAVVGVSFLLSSKLFDYLISASSYFSFFGWTINLIVFLLWLKHRRKEERFTSPLILERFGAYLTIFLIAVLAIASLWVKDFRTGFYSATAISSMISIAYLIYRHRRSGA
jgi:proline-specific permease ProY